jgi:hypothetical protein
MFSSRSPRRVHVLFDSILRPCVRDAFLLNILRGIGATVLQRLDVIDHEAPTGPAKCGPWPGMDSGSGQAVDWEGEFGCARSLPHFLAVQLATPWWLTEEKCTSFCTRGLLGLALIALAGSAPLRAAVAYDYVDTTFGDHINFSLPSLLSSDFRGEA